MVPTFAFYLIPTLLVFYGIRKLQERKWGTCKNSVKLDGKVAVVTGANGGIGFEIAKELARRGAKVVLACRNLTLAHEAITRINNQLGIPTNLIALELDLASLKSVEIFARAVQKECSEIHILVNNAGVSYPNKQLVLTHDGFEAQFGINHLGHFHLTNLLMDKLKISTPSRVVIISSSLHQKGQIKFDQIEYPQSIDLTKTPKLYADSKLANVYFCRELAKKVKGSRVSVFAVCPGWVFTGLFRHSIKWHHYILVFPLAFLFMRSPKQGSQTPLFCITEPGLENKSGSLFRDCKEFKSCLEFDDDISEKLWDESQRLVLIKSE